jgi:hypothetical protein
MYVFSYLFIYVVCMRGIYVRTYVCIMYLGLYIPMYVCAYVYMYECMHVFMYVCMYEDIYLFHLSNIE